MLHDPPRRRVLLAAALLLTVAALGAGVFTVRADRDERQIVQPYDPLPRW
jgi:hypothetical protein